jgi:sugar/nucleoside kinase (ribokinase family)
MARIAVVGNLAQDRVDGGPAQPGGGPFFAAQALRTLNRDGEIVTRCASPDRAFFEATLLAVGVPVTILEGTRTARFEHTYDGDVRTTRLTEVGETWAAADSEHLGPEVTSVHVAPLTRGEFPAETVAALSRGGRCISLDGQGLVRAPTLGPLVQDDLYDPAVLAHVTALKLSDEEAAIVAGGRFDAEAARRLGVREILVTLGQHGVDVWLDATQTHVAGSPVSGVEPTGSGDAFMVAYIAARDDGASPLDAASTGCAVVHEMLAERKRHA